MTALFLFIKSGHFAYKVMCSTLQKILPELIVVRTWRGYLTQ